MVPVHAFELNSKYAVLYNLEEEKIMYEMNKDEPTSIASLTKIMTTLVAIENIENYEEKVTLKESMFTGLAQANAAVIGLKEGQTVSYNDLLYGMFLASGADATRAIAISIAGSEKEFVDLMNQKVKKLGLKNTNFTNTVGLDDKNHYSTVEEVARILMEALKNEKFREIFETEKYTFQNYPITVESTVRKTARKYHINIDYIKGAKTGFTYDAGRCLASVAFDSKNNIHYLLITTNAPNINHPILDAESIYKYMFQNYKYQILINKNDFLINIPTKYSKKKNVEIHSSKEIKKYLKNDYLKEDIKIEYVGKKIITPNMKKDTFLGTITIRYQNEIVDKIEIRLNETIPFSIWLFFLEYKWIIVISLVGILLFSIIIFLFKKIKCICTNL